MTTIVTLEKLPKVSLNQLYAGIHWTKRKQQKDNWTWIVRSQFKGLFPKSKQYNVEYEFFWKKSPLDASNCLYSAKMIEDTIFEDDKHDIILSVLVKSRKGTHDYVKITVNEVILVEQKQLF